MAFSTPQNEEEYKTLHQLKKECNQKGFGLLVVDMEIENVTQLVYPRLNAHTAGSFLRHYADNESILRQLMTPKTTILQMNKRTPTQKRFYWKSVSISLLAFFTFIYFNSTSNVSSSYLNSSSNLSSPLFHTKTQVLLDSAFQNKADAEKRLNFLLNKGFNVQVDYTEHYQMNIPIQKPFIVILSDKKEYFLRSCKIYQKEILNKDFSKSDLTILTLTPK